MSVECPIKISSRGKNRLNAHHSIHLLNKTFAKNSKICHTGFCILKVSKCSSFKSRLFGKCDNEVHHLFNIHLAKNHLDVVSDDFPLAKYLPILVKIKHKTWQSRQDLIKVF